MAGAKILEFTPAIRGLLETDLSASLLAISAGIAVVVGVISGLYPAWRSSRLAPSAGLAWMSPALIESRLMNRHSDMMIRVAAGTCLALTLSGAFGAEPAPASLSAAELAARLSALQQNGASLVRLRMEINPPAGGAKTSLQLQIKSRRTAGMTEVVYHVLWPKERKGEAILLRKSGTRSPAGWHFLPPDQLRTIDSSQMAGGLFGSDLSCEDAVENFFAWPRQTFVGNEVVERVNCQILESKPGRGESLDVFKRENVG